MMQLCIRILRQAQDERNKVFLIQYFLKLLNFTIKYF